MILPEKVGIKDKFTFSCYSGFMWDIAPEFNALLVFAEHRSLLMSTFKSMTQMDARRLNNAIVYELQMYISAYYAQVLWRFPAFWKELYQQGSFKGNLQNAQLLIAQCAANIWLLCPVGGLSVFLPSPGRLCRSDHQFEGPHSNSFATWMKIQGGFFDWSHPEKF